VLFVAQCESDANLLLFSSHFRSNERAIDWCLSGMAEQQFLLVKTHPKSTRDPRRIRALVGNRGSVVDCHILDAVSLADVVVTISSTVALEAAWRRKPVVLLEPIWPISAAFATVPEPTSSASDAIARCLAEHVRHGRAMQEAALRVGCHLNAACAQLGNAETMNTVLRSVDRTRQLPRPEKPDLAAAAAALSVGAVFPRWARTLRRRVRRWRSVFNEWQ
jgi:hypothetical protein